MTCLILLISVFNIAITTNIQDKCLELRNSYSISESIGLYAESSVSPDSFDRNLYDFELNTPNFSSSDEMDNKYIIDDSFDPAFEVRHILDQLGRILPYN